MIITYFGTLRMHQIASFLSNVSGGLFAHPPSISVKRATLLQGYLRALCNILMLKIRRPPWTLYKVRLFCIVIRWSLTGQRYVDEVLHPHILQIYQTVENRKKRFSSSKTLVYLQYGKELFASWLCHTPLTGLLCRNSSLISHPCDILGWRIHDRIPSLLPHFTNLNTIWLNNDNVSHEGGGDTTQASFKHAQKPHWMHG